MNLNCNFIMQQLFFISDYYKILYKIFMFPYDKFLAKSRLIFIGLKKFTIQSKSEILFTRSRDCVKKWLYTL